MVKKEDINSRQTDAKPYTKQTRSVLRQFRVIFFAFFLFSVSLALGEAAQAASLHFSPSSGAYVVGKTFSVGIYVSSPDQAMNASSGVISYPADKLEATSLSKSGSIINLWVQEPALSNSAGTARFEGIVLNPGFTGSSGKILTINFKVKASGVASLSFTSGAVLANDGQGTNILTGMGTASFDLGAPTAAPAAPEAKPAPAVTGAPAAPQISSTTHSDPNKWYALSDITFKWSLPSGITGVNVLANRNASTDPGTRSDGVFSTYTYKDVDDGVWYFHLRLRNAAGWGGISHFRFQIDTEKPEYFNIKKAEGEGLGETKTKFIFEAKDGTSGIDYFEVQIDDGEPEVWRDDGSHIYETPTLGPGTHTLTAKAVDKAGNSLASSIKFEIKVVEPPVIVDYPKKLREDGILIVKGTTYPDVQVIFWLQEEMGYPASQTVQSDEKGNFEIIYKEKLKAGVYSAWTEVIDKQGAKSGLSEKIAITVSKPITQKIWWQIIILLIIIILIIILINILPMLHKIIGGDSSRSKKSKKKLQETNQSMQKTFDSLRKDLSLQFKLFEENRKRLADEEKRVVKQLERDLDKAKGLIKQRIKNIKKEIK